MKRQLLRAEGLNYLPKHVKTSVHRGECGSGNSGGHRCETRFSLSNILAENLRIYSHFLDVCRDTPMEWATATSI
jgi:hypothetical protein